MARSTRPPRGLQPISHHSLVDRITDELHRAILNGDLAPGSTVSIVDLCQRFDISHIPVREALRRLESEGVISLRPGRSALVADVTLEELENIYRLRKLIEGDLCLRAAKHFSEEQLEDAEVALAEYIKIEREPAALASKHHAFHAAMLGDEIGPADTYVLRMLWQASDRYLHLLMENLDHQPETQQTRIDEHRHLLDLARAGKARELRDSWVAHLDSTEAALAAALTARLAATEPAAAEA